MFKLILCLKIGNLILKEVLCFLCGYENDILTDNSSWINHILPGDS